MALVTLLSRKSAWLVRPPQPWGRLVGAAAFNRAVPNCTFEGVATVSRSIPVCLVLGIIAPGTWAAGETVHVAARLGHHSCPWPCSRQGDEGSAAELRGYSYISLQHARASGSRRMRCSTSASGKHWLSTALSLGWVAEI